MVPRSRPFSAIAKSHNFVDYICILYLGLNGTREGEQQYRVGEPNEAEGV